MTMTMPPDPRTTTPHPPTPTEAGWDPKSGCELQLNRGPRQCPLIQEEPSPIPQHQPKPGGIRRGGSYKYTLAYGRQGEGVNPLIVKAGTRGSCIRRPANRRPTS
jgi:hypothetical protein